MDTKDKIIQAATRLYAEKGYEGMTMKAIADEVGIKAPSVYAFYQGKEDILLHIYKDILSQHLSIAETTFDGNIISVETELKQFLDRVMDFQLQESIQWKIFIRLLLFPPAFFEINLKEELKTAARQEAELFSNLFQKGMDNGEIKKGDSKAIAHTLICLMDGLFWQMQRYDEASFKNRYEAVWSQFWKSITT